MAAANADADSECAPPPVASVAERAPELARASGMRGERASCGLTTAPLLFGLPPLLSELLADESDDTDRARSTAATLVALATADAAAMAASSGAAVPSADELRATTREPAGACGDAEADTEAATAPEKGAIDATAAVRAEADGAAAPADLSLAPLAPAPLLLPLPLAAWSWRRVDTVSCGRRWANLGDAAIAGAAITASLPPPPLLLELVDEISIESMPVSIERALSPVWGWPLCGAAELGALEEVPDSEPLDNEDDVSSTPTDAANLGRAPEAEAVAAAASFDSAARARCSAAARLARNSLICGKTCENKFGGN